jgi:hypothetical protein
VKNGTSFVFTGYELNSGIEERMESRMRTTTKKNVGLCATCASAATCTFPKESGRPVVFCEEFDGCQRNGAVENPDISAVPDTAEDKPRAVRSRELKGLCANCEIRETCTFPKAEGGIWHCEEYR